MKHITDTLQKIITTLHKISCYYVML